MTARDWVIVIRVKVIFGIYRWLYVWSPCAAEWWLEATGMAEALRRAHAWLDQ
jgi:hypothetical protein